MKYFSEKLNKVFDTAEACEKAEFLAKEQENREKILAERKAAEEKAKKEAAIAERKADATRVEEKRKALIKAEHEFREEIDNFVKKHGSYHWTSNSAEDIPTLFDSFLNPIFKAFL